MREIARAGDSVSDFPLVGGNELTILEDGDKAYPQMLAAIKNARHSIALTTYIFRMDDAGEAFVEALAQAMNRGVEVRVLVDGIGSGYFFSPAIRQLKKAGIKAHRFMHSWAFWKIAFVNLRNHKKLMIVDGTAGFVGGMNLSSKNILTKHRPKTVNDTHFCLTGPIVTQLMASFADDWHYTTGEQLNSKIWWYRPEHKGSASARVTNSRPDQELGKIETILAVAIGSAKHHIRIVTPYFLPDERLKFLIELAALRGVEVELIVPSHSDFALMDWAMRGHFVFMNLDRINCFQSPTRFDHSKLVTVDGIWCAFGSPNWDIRSMRLNFEILVESFDEKAVTAIDKLIDGKLATARRLTPADLKERATLAKLRDACARLLVPYL